MSKSLIKKLRKLDQISPDKNWQTSQRDFILSQIDNSDLVNNKENVSRWSNFYFSRLTFVAVRPVMSLVLMIMIVLSGSIATVSAAKGSLPGDALYSVKLAGEQVRLVLAPSDVSKVKVQLEIAENRVNEIKELVSQEGNGQKTADIKKTVENFNTSVTAIQKHISRASEGGATQDLIILAEEVNDKVKDYGDSLVESGMQFQEQKSGDAINKEKIEGPVNLEEKEIAETINEATASASFTSVDALRVLIYQENTEKVKINQQEVKNRILNEIDDYKEKFAQLSAQQEEMLNLYNTTLEFIQSFDNLETEKIISEEMTAEENNIRELNQAEISQIASLKEKLENVSIDLKEIDYRVKDSGQPIIDRLLALHQREKFTNFIDDIVVYRNNLININKHIEEESNNINDIYTELQNIESGLVDDEGRETGKIEEILEDQVDEGDKDGEAEAGDSVFDPELRPEGADKAGEELIEVEEEIENK